MRRDTRKKNDKELGCCAVFMTWVSTCKYDVGESTASYLFVTVGKLNGRKTCGIMKYALPLQGRHQVNKSVAV